jgi:hypothetical protein
MPPGFKPLFGPNSAGSGGRSAYLQAPVQDLAAKQPTSQGSNSLLSMLPSALAAGASFIPGIGTVTAAGLGAVGEAARQRMAGEDTDFGKIATEAGISAIPFGLGRVAKVAATGLKAAKAINLTTKGLQTAEKIVPAVTDAAEVAGVASKAPSFIGKIGNDLRAGVANPKVSASPFGATREAELANVPNVENLYGSAANQYKQLPSRFEDLSKNIKANLVNDIETAPKSTILNAAKTKLDELVNYNEKNSAWRDAKDLADAKVGKLLTENSSVADLHEARQKFGNQLQRAFKREKAGTPLSPEEEVMTEYWKAMGDVLGEKNPAVKELVSRQHNLFDYAPGLKIKSNESISLPFGMKSKALARGVQSVQDAGGRILQGAAGVAPEAEALAGAAAPATSFIGKAMNGVKGAAKYGGAVGTQELTRAAVGAAVPGYAGATADPQAAAAAVPTPANLNPAAAALGAAGASDSTQGQEPIDYNAEARKILSSGADAKTQGQQLDLLAKMQAIETAGAKASAGPKAVSSAANQQIANANSGLQQLGVLADELQKNPNVANTNAAASVLPGAVGNATRGIAGTQNFDVARNEIVDVLARLRTGAAISASEEKQYKSMLPTAGDTPEQAAHKIGIYQQLFQGILERAQSGSPSAELAGISQN